MDDGQTMRSMVRDDAYRVERVLSDGPSGTTEIVYLDDEGPLVRKRIPLSIANASAWAVAMESHEPLLPRIESLYRLPDMLVVVYDYVPGDSLADVIEHEGRMNPKRSVEVISDVCRAVAALHEHGVVHRDITPGNVILARDGAHLVDLGIARQHVEGRRRDTTTLGTWGFAAPEQYGFTQTDARSDVYSLGQLLGYLLTGVRPDADSFDDAVSDAAVVPEELAEVVHVATSFEPSRRYQSATALATAARGALDGQTGAHTTPDEVRGAPEAARGTKVTEKEAPTEPEASSGAIPDGERERAAYAWGGAPRAVEEPVTSARAPRKFTEAPMLVRVAFILAWFSLFVVAAADVSSCWGALREGDPPWGASQLAMAVALMMLVVALAVESYQALTWTGAYAEHERPSMLLLGNVATALVLFMLALLASSILLPS